MSSVAARTIRPDAARQESLGPVARGVQRLGPQRIVLLGVILILGYLAVVPLIMLLYGSLRDAPPGQAGTFTLENYVRAYSNPRLYASAFNTIAFSFGSTLVSLALGTFLAWVVERTNTPLRGVIFALSIVRIIVPGILLTIAWILLLSPNIGFVNLGLRSWLGLDESPFNIFSLAGMIWVEGLAHVPVAMLLMSTAFRAMDPSLEEAAQVSGSNTIQTFFRITLPMALPATLAATLIVFVAAFESFEVPALIGMRSNVLVFATEVFLSSRRTPVDLNLASTYATSFLLVAIVGVLLYQRFTAVAERYATVTGKGYRPSRIDLGRWKWFTLATSLVIVGVGFVLPLLVILWRSLLPFHRPPSPEAFAALTLRHYQFVLSFPTTFQAITNSLILGVAAATIVVVLTAIAAWFVVRSRSRLTAWLDGLTFIPITIPGVVMGLSLVWVYLTFAPALYATLWILLIGYVTRYLPYGMRFSQASIIQIHSELEGASQVAGASWRQTITRIILPLLAPGLITAWLYVMIQSFRELSTSVFLYHSGTEVVSVVIYDLWENGQAGPVSAFAMMMVAILGVLVVASRLVSSRFGIKA